MIRNRLEKEIFEFSIFPPNFLSLNFTTMKTNEFLSILDNPNLIEGIYNYCDRWCERCPMTTRCSVFLTTPKLEPEDFENEEAFLKAMMDSMSDSFQISMDLLQQVAEEENIDLSEANEDESFSEKMEAMQEEIERSPLSILSMEYLELGAAWLKTAGPDIKSLGDNLQRTALMDLPDSNPQEDALAMKNALENITYYLRQIHVKVVRAQTGRIRSDAWFEENDFPKDSDGSAKVALIGIDRCIGAWGVMLPHLPDHEESILTMLSKLQQLRNLVEDAFPDARSFRRPGFDD